MRIISATYSSGSSPWSFHDANSERTFPAAPAWSSDQPCSTADGDCPQLALRGVILHTKPVVIEKAPQRELVANGVSECSGDEPAFGTLFVLGACPSEKGIDERAYGLVALRLALNRSELRERPVGLEDRVDEAYPVQAERVLADGGFPVLAASVRKASDLNRRRSALARLVVRAVGWDALEERVVDDVGVGLHVAGEPVEHLPDREAGVFGLKVEKDVIPCRPA
jgi:hypothetical protein